MTTDTAPVPNDDEFASAFAELSATADPAPAPVEPAAPVTPEPTPAPAAPVEPVAPVTPEPAPAPAPVEPAPAPVEPAPAPAPAPVAPTAEELATQLAAALAQVEELKKAPPAPAPVAPAAPEPAPTPAPPLYSADEQAAIDKYRKDWPDIANAEALVRKAEYSELVGYVFSQIQQVYGPVAEYFNQRAPSDQYRDVVALVPDYDQVHAPALEWVGKQPDYLRDAYTAVVENGTAEQVADLLNRFKKETNWVAPVGAPAPAPALAAPVVTPPVPAPAAPLDPAAAAAAARLTVVPTGRSTPVTGADPNNFDQAFAEFSSEKTGT